MKKPGSSPRSNRPRPKQNPASGLDRWSPLLPDEAPVAAREYTVRAKVWRYSGKSAWHFANLSAPQSADIRAHFSPATRGWGSIRVHIRVGNTEWATSLFPDSKSKSYLFAIKASVREAESIAAGDQITAVVRIA